MTVENLNISVKTNADKAAQKLDTLSAALKGVREAADGVVLEGGVVAVGKAATQSKKEVEALSAELQDTIRNASKYQTLVAKAEIARGKMNEAFKAGDEDAAWSAREREINAAAQAAKELERIQEAMLPKESAPAPVSVELQGIIQSANEVDILRNKLEGLKAALQEAFESGNTEKAWALQSQILSTAKSLDKAEEAARRAAGGIEEVGKAANKTHKPLGNFLSSLKRIAFYRIIRSIIKNIAQAFQEGLEKAYLFSAAIEDAIGHRFAAAMDSIKSSANAMEGQLGSAFIGLLTALEPIIVRIIDLVTRAADAMSQFFAAFTGTTYLKANKTAAQFSDAMSKGAKSAKEWKNQLLGFDEINKLNEPSNGGSSSSPLDGYDMVSTDISEFWMRMAKRIKPILEDIKMAFQGLRDFVVGVFTGDLEKAFRGLGSVVRSLGKLVNDVIKGVIVPAFDGLSEHGIESIGKLFDYLEEKTGKDLSGIERTVLTALNFIRFAVEGMAIKIGYIVQDLCDTVGYALSGDWDKAWSSAQKLVTDASINVAADAYEMAVSVTNDMIGGGNASADFAEVFSRNMETVRRQVEATGRSSLSIEANPFGLRFSATTSAAQAFIARMYGASSWKNGDGFSGNTGKFASGGFPQEGQLFLAREAGPELVGTMGGRTAVANNQEITEGIRQAVYDAMVASNTDGGNGDYVVKVYLDGKEIKSSQTRLARATGV